MVQWIRGSAFGLALAIAVLVASITSCSSGSANSRVLDEGGMEGTGLREGGNGGDDEGGMEGTGVIDQKVKVLSYGTISGFGSIYVNGVKYETDDAEIEINDDHYQQDDSLKLGMVVQVFGQFDSDNKLGLAARVVYDRDVAGPIESILEVGAAQKILTILGLKVSVNAGIVFDNVSFETLGLNQTIEVSGFQSTSGTLLATRVERIMSVDGDKQDFEVEAIISSINAENMTLSIGSTIVDYSQIDFDSLPEELLSQGLFAEIKGDLINEKGHFVASSIRVGNSDYRPAKNTKLEIEGVVDRFEHLALFRVGRQRVNASAALIDKGQEQDLRNGVQVEVEGIIEANGILRAARIVVKTPSNLFIEGIVSDIDVASGLIVIAEDVVQIDSLTRFEDRSVLASRFFYLHEIAIGDVLLVRAKQIGDVKVADSIERLETLVEEEEFISKGQSDGSGIADGGEQKDDLEQEDSEQEESKQKESEQDESDQEESELEEFQQEESEESESEQDEVDQDEVDQDEVDQDEADQDEADQDEADQDEADQDESEQDESEQDESEQDESEQDESDQDESDQDESEQDESDQDESDQGESDQEESDQEESEQEVAEQIDNEQDEFVQQLLELIQLAQQELENIDYNEDEIEFATPTL